MKTVELMNGVFYSGYRTLKKIHQSIMWIAYGLKWLIMPAASWIVAELCTKKHFQTVVLFPLGLHLLWTHRVLPVILWILKIFESGYRAFTMTGQLFQVPF